MNEQIRNILEEAATKTSKIQQQLLLGLTRREIADLITNGNYGFVHNVCKKMLQNGSISQWKAFCQSIHSAAKSGAPNPLNRDAYTRRFRCFLSC